MSLINRQLEMRSKQAESKREAPLFRDFIAEQVANDLIVEVKTCRCLREMNLFKVHCPTCGLRPERTYATLELRQLPDGTEVYAIRYKCRGCRSIYTDVDCFYHCEAPEVTVSMREVRAKHTLDNVVEKVMKDRGIEGGTNEFLQKLMSKRQREGRETYGIQTDLTTELTQEEEPKSE